MGQFYFNPGCALSLYKPDMENRIVEWLEKVWGPVQLHKTCCQHDPRLPEGSTIINVCAGCDERFGSLYKGISTISLWEILDSVQGLKLPDYHGAKMSVHDPCPVRGRSAVHQAVRSLLGKMNIEVVEADKHGAQSVCCGDSLWPQCDAETIRRHMRMRAQSMPSQDVVVYCVSCIKAMDIGGRTPRHMVDLLFHESTDPQDNDTDRWHAVLKRYIAAH